MQIVAHRGASGSAPENTLAALNLAWELGADGVEIDIHLTADGVPVCIHDPNLTRLAGVNADVSALSLAELQELDVGIWKGPEFIEEYVPTLEEALATVPEYKTLLIEVKDIPVKTLNAALGPILERNKHFLATRQVYFMSFFPDLLWKLQSAFPDLTLLLLADKLRRLPPNIPARVPSDTLPVHGIGFSHKLDIPQRTIEALNGAGAILAVWTENDPARKAFWEDRDFDFLITDHPERFL